MNQEINTDSFPKSGPVYLDCENEARNNLAAVNKNKTRYHEECLEEYEQSKVVD